MKLLSIAAIVVTALTLCSPLGAQSYTFETILSCNNLTAFPAGVNGSGVVVGVAHNISGPGAGMIYSNGQCKTYASMLPYGVTDTGTLLASFPPNQGEYLIEASVKVYGPLPNYPGTEGSLYCCMDTTTGTLAGNYWPAIDEVGFFYRGGNFASLPWTGNGSCCYEYTLGAFNSTGIAVGTYQGTYVLGFAYQNEKMSVLSYPGATYTNFNGINDNGVVVGTYVVKRTGASNVFLYDTASGTWTDLNFPSPYNIMIPVGISNTGVIVLQYSPSGGMVIATPAGN